MALASSHSRKSPSPSSSNPQFTTTNFIPMPDHHILHDAADSTLIDPHISLPDAGSSAAPKTVDDVWREIIAGDRRDCKEESTDEMMTLEDFLAKAGAVGDGDGDVDEVKMSMPLTERLSGGGSGGVLGFDPFPPTSFQGLEEGSLIGFGNGVEMIEGGGGGGGRGRRGRSVSDQLDKVAQQRQRRMIKNRESAARSRERKQAYQLELESLAVKLEEENDRLLKEKAEKKKERYKQLMEKVIPIVEKRRPPRLLRRVRSMQW